MHGCEYMSDSILFQQHFMDDGQTLDATTVLSTGIKVVIHLHFDKERQSSDNKAQEARVTVPNHMFTNIKIEPQTDTSTAPNGLDITDETLTIYPTENASSLSDSENDQ
jgi:hypothetical protein